MRTKRFLKVGNYTEEIPESLFIKLRKHQGKKLPIRGLMTIELENRSRYSDFSDKDYDLIQGVFYKGEGGFPYIYSEDAISIHKKISKF